MDFADMIGWKELAEKAERFFNSLPDSSKQNSIIFCRNYGQAGSLKFYGKEKSFTSKVISENGSFVLWIPWNNDFKNLILVARNIPGKDDGVFQYFEKMIVVDSVTNKLSRQLGDKIIYFENIDSIGLKIAKESLKTEQSKFIR